MHDLVALDLPGGSEFVDELVRAWDTGDAVLPVDQRLPSAARRELLERMGATVVVERGARHTLRTGWPVEQGDALVVATSGSTGARKGAVLTHDAVAASAVATSERLEVSENDHWLACLPLSHVGGLSVVTRALRSGTRLTVHPGFDADEVEASGATLVSLVPTALRRVDTSIFRTIVLGGSRPPNERPSNVVTTYGMTESGSGVVYDRRALGGVELRIVDDEVQIRCPMLLRAYRDGHDPKTADGWYPTGDLGELDSGGLLSVHGRRSDVIITGGENVWPEPVEEIILSHPDVAEVAVIGVDDDEWGEVVTALVVPTVAGRAVALEPLRELVRHHLSAPWAPRRVELVSQLPRTRLGKLIRSELTARSE